MKVERIERSKHKQERVLVYLEGGNLLRITESELLRFGLYVGLDISPETVVQLQKSGARSETRVRAANMISARPLSKRELTRRLVQKGAEADDAGAAAEYLENIGALDDAAYAAMLVRHYSAQAAVPPASATSFTAAAYRASCGTRRCKQPPTHRRRLRASSRRKRGESP